MSCDAPAATSAVFFHLYGWIHITNNGGAASSEVSPWPCLHLPNAFVLLGLGFSGEGDVQGFAMPPQQ